MAKSENQKQKLFRILEILMRHTDEDHGLTINEIISRLEEYGISAERKSLYSDFATLEELGFSVVRLYGNPPGYTLAERIFELPEYAFYRPPVETEDYMTDMSGKFGGIGVMVEYNDQDETIMVNTVYPGSPAEKAGIKVGDYFYSVDGKTVEELGYTNAVNYIRGEIGTTVTLVMLRDGEKITVTAIRDEVEEINVAYEIDTEKNIGYVQIVAFKENTFPQFKEAIDSLEAAGVKGIVFDLRNNPGGYVDSVVSVISYLIPNGKRVMSYQYKGYGEKVLNSKDDGEDHKINVPCVVICNQYTASAGEIFTSAIRDYRNKGEMVATIVGVNTYGKGIMQSSYYYPLDKSTVTFTVAYYNPPYGGNYHGTGVAPDDVVEIENNLDTQYEAAVNELQKLIIDN